MLAAALLASPLVGAPSAWATGEPSGGSGTGSTPAPAPAPAPSPTPTPTPTPSTSGGATPETGGVSSLTGTWGATPTSLLTTATGDGITVTTRMASLFGHRLSFIGVTSATPGSTVAVQRLAHTSWVTVATATVGVGGVFWARWLANYAGVMTMRTVLGQTATASQTGVASSPLVVTVYRPALATYYGNGFYGQRTACGQILTPAMLGVANRTMRCGARVRLYFQGHTIVVPVIDRGPYANGADWDLTQATAVALGIFGTETVGVMPA